MRFFQVIIIAILILFYSCKKENNNTLTFITTAPQVAAAADTITLSVHSNVSWTIMTSESWCTPLVEQANGNAEFKVVISDNYTKTERTAIITLSGGGESTTLKVTQTGESFLASSPEIIAPAVNSYDTLNLRTTETWSLTVDQTWCTLAKTSGTGNTQILISCPDNLSGLSRSATVKVTTSTGLTQNITITQSAGQTVFEDDFYDNQNSWDLSQTNDSLVSEIKNGQLHLYNFSKTETIFVGNTIVKKYSGNYQILISYKLTNASYLFAILFGVNSYSSPSNFYMYSPNYSLVDQYIGGKFSTIIDETKTNGYRKGEQNILRLFKKGTSCAIYNNDSKDNSFTFSPAGGDFVFWLYPGVEVYVDYMKVTLF